MVLHADMVGARVAVVDATKLLNLAGGRMARAGKGNQNDWVPKLAGSIAIERLIGLPSLITIEPGRSAASY